MKLLYIVLLTLMSCGSFTPNKVYLREIACVRVEPNSLEAYSCSFGEKINLQLKDSNLVLYAFLFDVQFVSDSTRTSLYHPFREGIDGLTEDVNRIVLTLPDGDSIKTISAPYENWQNFDHEGICLRSDRYEYQCAGSIDHVLKKINETDRFMVWHVPILFALRDTITADTLNVLFR